MWSLERTGKWVVFAAAALLLLATSGLSVSRMTCLKGGFSVYTWGASFTECGMEETPDIPVVRDECCTYGQVVVELPQLQHDRAMQLGVPVVVAEHLGSVYRSAPQRVGVRVVHDVPIPPSERRSLLGVYRI